jgi:uncharacterized membrane protein
MRDRDLEDRYGWVIDMAVMTSSLVLAAGLIVHMILSDVSRAALFLRAGLVLLMATPALRIFIALAERVRRRDLQFVAIAAIVVLELSLALWYAATRV